MGFININGNIESLKESILNEIEALYDLQFARNDFLPQELALEIAGLTGRINREIAVYMNRKGSIVDISIGDSGTVSLPEFDGRKSKTRLSGIRCIHTHPNGDGMLSPVDISALLGLRLDAMVSVGVREGNITDFYAALPVKDENGEFNKTDIYGPFDLKDLAGGRLDTLFEMISEKDKTGGTAVYINDTGEERAILVGLESSHGRMINGKSEGERSLDELEELAFTAGAVVSQKILQRKSVKDPAYYIGKGKLEELGILRQTLNANVLIFDDELSGAQVRNIEEVAGVKAIDRTTLILDIFARRARSREGKRQVELAQLKYRLPRLIGLGNQLSRLGGGIGTRGPGEKKLEVDRRHIRRRVSYLESELKDLSRRRSLIREGRKKDNIPAIALVGYTNTGKSTLMNKLCTADVFVENKLFATLDPTIRSLTLPEGRQALLIDTVGFIRKLPHELVEAFKSTLEEAVFADVLLHVVDVTSEEMEEQISVVNEILGSLGAQNKPVIRVLNKVDLLKGELVLSVIRNGEKVFEVSAVTGEGLDELAGGIAGILPAEEIEVNVLGPYSEGWIPPYIHEHGKVKEMEYTDSGVRIKALIKKAKADRIREYIGK